MRSYTSVRSYYFRALVADNSDAAIAEFKLADYRIFWRWANNKARRRHWVKIPIGPLNYRTTI
jgi:hypothetical protein